MTVFVIYSCSLDGDSWLAYACKAVCADIPAAQRWIAAHPIDVAALPINCKPAVPRYMHSANGWTFFGTRAEVELLDQQSKAGDFGYIVEETEVLE